MTTELWTMLINYTRKCQRTLRYSGNRCGWGIHEELTHPMHMSQSSKENWLIFILATTRSARTTVDMIEKASAVP